MTLSVIIPTHRRPNRVCRLLLELCKQEFPFKDLQVFLISNLKDKILRRKVEFWQRKFFDFKYIETGFVGVNTARNTGIRFAGGQILYFLDDDCLLPHPRHLANVVQAHKKNPSLVAIGGPYQRNTDLAGVEKFYFEHSKIWVEQGKRGKGQLLGGNTSYKREVFDKGFCFDSSIVFGGSEESLNQFLKKCAYKTGFDDSLYVFHNLKMGLFSLIKKSWQQGKGLLTNRLIEGQKPKSLQDIKSEWAFFTDRGSVYFFIYALFFKLGYFWSLSLLTQERFSLRGVRFLKLLLKSRLFFISEYLFVKYVGRMWYYVGWLWGYVLLRFMGRMWYYVGWLWGYVLLRFMGNIWYVGSCFLCWLHSKIFPRATPLKPSRFYPFYEEKLKVLGFIV